MSRIVKLATVIGILIVLLAFFVPEPDLYALPTGFCGLYGSPVLECSHTAYFSLTAWYLHVGTFSIDGQYFLELCSKITIQIF